MLFVTDDRLVELANRLSGKVILSSEITGGDLAGIDIESLIAHVVERFESKGAIGVLNRDELKTIIGSLSERKEPVQVEVIRSSDFKPAAKEVSARFTARSAKIERTNSSVSDFVDYFRDRFNKMKGIMKGIGNGYGGTVGIGSVKQYISGREMGIIGHGLRQDSH